MEEEYPSEVRHVIKKYIDDSDLILDEGPAGIEQILCRFQDKYNYVTKEIERSTYLYVALCFLYFMKILSIGVSIKVFDQKILEIPHALFTYCLSALFLFIFSSTRNIDSLFYSSYIKEICSRTWKNGATWFINHM